ncbi:NAD(P)/FAD-dependent oxidoreductase [Congregibacter brevis]|uniref:NAD(P)/FAD-dependent oxidoreductase n=1 Tax=Congregibacter brevis TaxID=3081201 RepID=A0ABZ0IHT4_9GAMM|nr:NAD(P)/FAD-dependent oxidoreductase [Congregibacter sp. IMCC45268]
MNDILDVVIIGAGLSGVGAACHMKRNCPERKIALLEARERSGGTWDLFRYPGIRSDSDMHTLGYSFKPWEASKAIADGPSILSYVRETAKEYGVESLIRYQQKVRQANWSSEQQCWELTIEDGSGGTVQSLKTRFLHLCAGYYNYNHGHQPEFPGREAFQGEFVHPQFWPEGLNYENKRVLIIGSGATAMTLVPSMADKAAEVVMLQRSPTWVVSRASTDWIANFLKAVLPKSWAYNLTRWKNTRMQHWLYKKTRKQPEKVRQMLLDQTRKELGDAGDMADFTPEYNPWDQRLCLVPDSDLFGAIHSGKARVVTNQIDTLTAEGVRLADGTEIAADIIVSATGLELELMGGIDLQVDGEAFDIPSSWSYRGMMCTGLPNMVSVFGYINASWTLRADLVSQWMCRLLAHMDSSGASVVTAAIEEDLPPMEARPWIDNFSAGYMQRVMHLFPKQGDRNPWVNSQNYLREKREFEEMSFTEAALKYESPRNTESDTQRAA